MQASEGRFTGAAGTPLHWLSHVPERPRSVLVIVHGLSDHAARYSHFASTMASAGIATFAFDLRGHGRSPGPRGHAPSFEVLLDDVASFHEFVQDGPAGGLPRFLFGHSMGGLIALRYLQERAEGLRGGILSAPWLATKEAVPAWKRVPAVVLERILPSLSVPAGLAEEAISDDPAAVRAYRDDPLVHGRISPRLFREAERSTVAVRSGPVPDVPSLLFVAAQDDAIVDTGATLSWAEQLHHADVTVRTWPTGGHELLNSTKRDEVSAVLREWILARSPA